MRYFLLKIIRKLLVVRLILAISLLYTGAITWLSLAKLGKISIGTFNPTDKMLHSGAYLFLCLLWNIYFHFRTKNEDGFFSILTWVGVGCLIFGMLIEVLQGTLTSYRDPDWWDILANSVGVILGSLFFILIRKRISSWRQVLH